MADTWIVVNAESFWKFQIKVWGCYQWREERDSFRKLLVFTCRKDSAGKKKRKHKCMKNLKLPYHCDLNTRRVNGKTTINNLESAWSVSDIWPGVIGVHYWRAIRHRTTGCRRGWLVMRLLTAEQQTRPTAMTKYIFYHAVISVSVELLSYPTIS